jgi:hypothetical protein
MMIPKRKRSPLTKRAILPESSVQASCVQLFDAGVDPADAILFAVPNGELRDGRTAAFLVSQGVREGVSDLVLVVRGLVLFIEVKRPEIKIAGKIEQSRGRTTKSQDDFRDRIRALAHCYRVIDSVDEFVAILAEFRVPCRAKLLVHGIFVPPNPAPGKTAAGAR